MPANSPKIRPADVIIPADRLRPADPNWVEALAAMIEEGGQEQPIVIRPKDGGYHLVIGLHRLEALKLLGVDEMVEGVNYKIKTLDDDQARLAEIDENLGRNELSALDRALFLAERKAVYERLNPETAHGAAKKPKKDRLLEKSQSLRLSVLPPRFTLAAADKTGLSERSVQLSLELAAKLTPGVIALLREAGLERNQAALVAIAAEKPHDQVRIVRAMKDGDAPTIQKARVSLGLAQEVTRDEQAKALADLHDAWRRAGARTRATFRHFIDSPEGKPLPKPVKKG